MSKQLLLLSLILSILIAACVSMSTVASDALDESLLDTLKSSLRMQNFDYDEFKQFVTESVDQYSRVMVDQFGVARESINSQ